MSKRKESITEDIIPKLGDKISRREYQKHMDIIKTERKIIDESIFETSEQVPESIFSHKNDEICKIVSKKKKALGLINA